MESWAALGRLKSELRLRGYARRTQKSYIGCCRRFSTVETRLWPRPADRGSRLPGVARERGVSRSAFTIAYSARSFLYGVACCSRVP